MPTGYSEENGDVTPYDLSKAQLERLAILSEECAEVQQIIGKIIRHGYESYNPFDDKKTTNRQLLEKELGDVMFGMQLLIRNKEVNHHTILDNANSAEERKKRFLHHQ